MEQNTENVKLSTALLHLGPMEGPEFEGDLDLSNQSTWAQYLSDFNISKDKGTETRNVVNLERESSIKSVAEDTPSDTKKEDVFKSCLLLNDLGNLEDGRECEVGVEELQVGNECEGAENVESLKSKAETASTGVTSQDMEQKLSDVAILSNQDREEIVGVEDAESVKLEVETESTLVNLLNIEQTHSDVAIVSNQDNEESERIENSPKGSESRDESTICVTEEPQPYSDDNEKFYRSRPTRIEISLCGNLLRPGMGLSTASETFNAHRIPEEEFRISAASIIKNDSLIVRIEDKYFTWEKAAHIVLGVAVYGLEMHADPTDAIPVEWSGPNGDSGLPTTPSGRRWRLWPIAFRRTKTLDHNTSNLSGEDVFLDSESVFDSPQPVEASPTSSQSPQKQFLRTQVPTSEQISSLNLKDGQNMVSFIFSTRMLGVQKVDAHIYLWKWNARIVISDVDGTITKSDVLGQFMPLVGKDWTQSGVARLFFAIKENGYQLLFLSARAIVQAYLTRSFLLNLKQDGKALPNGPVVISPDGLFPSLFREVIRRAPHEFKIVCLEMQLEMKCFLQAAGNEAYKAEKFTDAVNKYTSAIACSIESRPFAAICFCNRAAAYRALGQITDAIADCSLAISLDPSYLKAVSRRASLYEMIRDYGQAAIDLRKSVSILTSQMEEKGILSGVSDISSGMNELRQTQLRLYNIEKESRKGIPLNMYLILGVESTSAESEVKKAYRKAALKHHPDKAALSVSRCDNGDDGVWKEIAENVHKDADRLFKMIGEAYDVLSNPSKRSEYDIDEDMRNKVNKFTRSSSGRMAADVQSPVFERSGSRQWQYSLDHLLIDIQNHISRYP